MWELDATARLIVIIAGGVIAAAVVLRVAAGVWGGRGRRVARRTQRRTQRVLEAQAAERKRHAAKIIATSSTANIVGYELVRQIEAVFVDGHKTPAQATESLKAIAGLKGGNAIVNLTGERVAGGGCAARGDAVIVRRIEEQPVTPHAVVIENPPKMLPPQH